MGARGESISYQQLPKLARGMYTRLAKQLGYNISYIIRVAHSERQSPRIEAALNKEISRILKLAANGNRKSSSVLRKNGGATRKGAEKAVMKKTSSLTLKV
jgi:hypothetical protein